LFSHFPPFLLLSFSQNPLAKTWFGRIRLRLSNVSEEYSRPVWEVLLPDPLPSPYQRPYTLVLDLDDLLIHSSWSRAKGWQIAKRPGLDYFLGYLSQFYEIVIYTRQPFFTAEQVVDKLDPDKRKIMYSLFKEACRSHQGKLVKDLSSLNRDPKKVIVLDTESDGFMLQPENGILVKPWKGEKGDRELMGLLNFLESEFETIRTHSNLFTKLRVHDLSLPPSLFSQQLVSTVSQTSERL